MDAVKQWTPPKAVRDFRYHITDIAAQRFRERVDDAIRTPSDHDTALQLDAKIQHAYDTKNVNDIVDASCPSEVTKIAQITLRPGVENYVVLRMVRPNSYPAPHTVGGPAGAALGAIDLVPIDLGQQRFANGHWKVAFRQLEGPLTKLLRERPFEGRITEPAKQTFAEFANAPPFPTSVLAVSDHVTQQGTTMDAQMTTRKPDFTSLNEQVARSGPQPVKTVHVKTHESGRRTYTDDYAMKMAKEWGKSGMTRTAFAEKHDIDSAVLCRWVIKYKVKPSVPVASSPKREYMVGNQNAVGGNKGHTDDIRRFMADGKPHSIQEVAKAIGYDDHNCGITMSRIYQQGELSRPEKGIYQATKWLRKVDGGVAPLSTTQPTHATSTTDQRREFARKQFSLNPDITDAEINNILRDRFGESIMRKELTKMRREANGKRPAAAPANTKKAHAASSDIHQLAQRFADAMQAEKQLAQRLVELKSETHQCEMDLKEARETSTALLKQMQQAHG